MLRGEGEAAELKDYRYSLLSELLLSELRNGTGTDKLLDKPPLTELSLLLLRHQFNLDKAESLTNVPHLLNSHHLNSATG